MSKIFPCLFLLLFAYVAFTQAHKVVGRVQAAERGEGIAGAIVFIQQLGIKTETNTDGFYQLLMPEGKHRLEVFSLGWESRSEVILVKNPMTVNFVLVEYSKSLEEVEVNEERVATTGIARLGAVEGLAIYEAKKNELIILDDFAANKVANNARQLFAKVPGLTIWESDFAGLQLDIAARGLGPGRTANFNTRQNGYDMSADALGYPESYYIPAMQAVDKIEVVRGAASLQYGTQFGGMLNFKLRKTPQKKFEANLEQAIGSFGLLNSFASVGGTVKKMTYYSYYQYRRGDGWRDYSAFDSNLAFARVGYSPSDKLKFGFEYSYMDYVAQQSGGLTDDDFQKGNLSISRRNRNWFQVNWNLVAFTLDYELSYATKFNIRTFGLLSNRDALGNLEQIDRLDNSNSNRTLIKDEFSNFGGEARILHYYNLRGKKSALLAGLRYYHGLTHRKQGNANNGSGSDFYFLNPNDLEDFDYDFPGRNYSFFAENIFNITDKLSITPGVRLEYIRTDAKGIWKQIVRNFAGEIVAINEFKDDQSVRRSFALFGMGASYHLSEEVNLYANFSENYRSITFSDLRLNNPNFVLDSLIVDESGYNADIGVRGQLKPWINVDVSVFYLRYNDRIGVLLPPKTTTLLRTNIGDSRHYGIESFVEFDLIRAWGMKTQNSNLALFTNLSLINATYIASQDNAIVGNKVEYVPSVMLRTGINYGWREVKATFQISYLDEQFSDATNSTFNPSALTGLIPSYYVMDFSLEYQPDRFKFTMGVNNLTNEKYFTRRAESYPGPGIIPATIRSFYFSVGVRI